MRAVRFHEYGGFDVLGVEEVEDLAPEAGEVLISVRAAGINPIDWKKLHGFLASVAPIESPPVWATTWRGWSSRSDLG